MSVFVQTNANPSNPDPAMPFLEKDSAIIRGVTRAMFDVSNPDCYQGSGNLVGGTTFFNDLTSNNYDAAVRSSSAQVFPPIETGMIKIQGGSGSSRYIALPSAAFKFGSSTKKALIIFYMKCPNAGFAANMLGGIIGSGAEDFQYTCWLASNGTGAVDYLRVRVKGAGVNIDVDVTDASMLTGSTKQIGLAFDIKTNGTAEISIYINGVKAATSTGNMTQFFQYTNSGLTDNSLFMSPLVSFLSDQNVDLRLGRVSSHDLTNNTNVTFDSILSKDRAAAQGYVY